MAKQGRKAECVGENNVSEDYRTDADPNMDISLQEVQILIMGG
jgi:hypothetical protein